MKNLKAKHFRYLGKEYVKEPLDYIKRFYGDRDVNQWKESVYVFITSGSVQDRPSQSNPSSMHQHIINHIDVAYILRERGIAKGMGLRFLDFIFEFYCREYWLETLDELLKNETDANYTHDTDNYNLYVINFIEIFHYLIHYFYLLSLGSEEDFQIPLYVMCQRWRTDEESPIVNCQTRIPQLAKPTEDSYVGFYHREKVTLPEYLSTQAYSTAAVQNFFQVCSLSNWKDDIWHWYQTVITEDMFWSANDRKFSGTNLLHDYSCLYALLDMYRSQQSYNRPISNYTFDDNHPRSIFKECAGLTIIHDSKEITFHYVLKEELDDPLSAILSLIDEYSALEWDEILYDWLSFGLSANALSDERYTWHSAHIYQVLVKIIELSYVLAFRKKIECIHL